MDNRSLKVLEYPKILNQFKGFCVSEGAKERALALRPFETLDDVERALEMTNETLNMMLRNGRPPLSEIKNGKKETHWMWFIFPQIKGLGKSDTANYYAINDLKEATEFLEHPILGKHLIEISELFLTFKRKSADGIL
ncbi:MAG: DUF1810 family protein, partial [Eubacterium sp.]